MTAGVREHLAPDYVRAVSAAAQAVIDKVSSQGYVTLEIAAGALVQGCPMLYARWLLGLNGRSSLVHLVAALALNEGAPFGDRELAVDWLIAAAQLGAWGLAEAARVVIDRERSGRTVQ